MSLAAWTWAGGGFRVTLFGLTISVRAAWPPAVAGLAAWAVFVAWRRLRCRDDAEAVQAMLARVGAPVALAVCGATLAAGLTWGSTVAAGADSSGYLAQAALWRRGELIVNEPLSRHGGSASAWLHTPLGFRPGSARGTIVPSYPPGLPLQLAFASMLGERAVALVVPLLGALAVWCTFLLGRGLAGSAAGVAAAVLLASSPVFLNQLVQPMSDVPVTAWWSIACCALVLGARHGAFGAGLASGVALITRPNLVLLLPVMLALASWSRPAGDGSRLSSRFRRLTWFVAGLSPFLALLAWFNNTLYGAPWASGYGDAAQLFAFSNVWTNLQRYSGWLVEVHAPLLALAALGCLVALSPASQRRWPVLGGCVSFVLVVCASYLAYAPFESWTYLRFLLPAIAALAALAGAAWSALPRTAPTWAVVGVGAIGLALVAGHGVGLARSRGAFDVASREARYERIAEWVREHTSDASLVLCSQHSGSIHHTAGRSVLRWDLATPDDLRSALDVQRRWSSVPQSLVIVLDADEEPAFRSRHGAVSELGQLDWPPRAATPPPTPARVYFVEDAETYRQGRAIATESLSLPR